MPQLHFTNEALQHRPIDREPFKFSHKLGAHPALQLDNLSKVLPRLPKDNVFYSAGLQMNDNFDRAHIEKSTGESLESTIEKLRHSNAYIMVRAPEQDPSFRGLYRELLSDVNTLTRTRGLGDCAEGSMLYLFIASPNSVTPFHLDRYSTFLFQFRGTKTVWVAPPWDPRVITPQDTEAFVSRSGHRPAWKPEFEALGTPFNFSPDEGLHIPFVSGHYVKNGPEDVSISMSIIFNTRETTRQTQALMLNHKLRSRGLSPAPVGDARWRDHAKAAVFDTLQRTVQRLRGKQFSEA